MANPKITLSAGSSPTEGATGTYLITLDTPAPTDGLMVYYNTTGSTATFSDDYNFEAGENLTAVTDNSFTVAAGATSATLNLIAHADGVADPNETVMVNLTAGTGYDLVGTNGLPIFTNLEIDGDSKTITADFNNDGIADLAIANWLNGNISVLLGNGSGGFMDSIIVKPETPYSYSYFQPSSITAADFNNDGKLDLAAADWSDDTVKILLGNGSGGFTDNASVNTGSEPLFVTTADFNNDGNVDLAIANNNSTVSIRLGNGKSGFTGSASVIVGSWPSSITVADFNNDGKLDLATANNNSNNVSVRLGDGSGGFTGNTNTPVGGNPYSITAADFNNDGNMDFATANNVSSKNVSIRLGDGTGGFTGNTSIPVESWPYSITAADISTDGNNVLTIADIAPINHAPTGDVTITGNTVKGETLTASNTLVDMDGLGVITYQWQANNVNIGAGNSYVVTDNEIGKTISVIASYTDGLSKVESVTSGLTIAVTDTLQSGASGVNITGSGFTTSEQGDTAVFSVTLNTAPIRDVTINFSSTDTTEGVITSPTLTFTSVNWSTPQTFTVTGQNDNLDDGDVAYSVHAKLTTLDVIYRYVRVNNLTLTNQDTSAPIVETINDTSGIVILQGTSAPSYILGEAAGDDLSGGAGNDTIYGSYGDDLLFGEDDNDILYGEQDNDYLDGGAGNDTLDGGLGLDTLIGGSGNDTYYLGYDAKDVITDNGLATDIDTVIMPYQLTSYTLSTGIEKGTIAAGAQASNLTGNTSNNALTGNDGNNILNGAVGRDSLFGSSGNDVLVGGIGNDTLSGGVGQDIFKFDAALPVNIDKITDFVVADDTIQLENGIFTKLKVTGGLNADNFVTSTAAVDSNDYLVYNKATGALFYDANGSGAGAAVQIALLGVNLALTNADFVII